MGRKLKYNSFVQNINPKYNEPCLPDMVLKFDSISGSSEEEDAISVR